jgi:16S rRNA U516 pseudouridylate synthase RsuA-like enzyme
VGRLDKDTSGLLLMTDDGQLLHSIQSPTKGTASSIACPTVPEPFAQQDCADANIGYA